MGNPKKSYRNSSGGRGGRGGRGGGGDGGGGGEEIHSAARSGDLTAVQAILSSNPLAINSRDKLSRTPLHLAAWSGQAEVVSYLCKQKADVGAAAMDDMGAIHFAAQKGHREVVRDLISFGVSVKASTRKGLTPLHYAAQGSHLDLIKYLVKKDVNFSAKTKAGKTPLDLASSEEIRSFLVESERSSKKKDVPIVKEKTAESDHKQELQEEKSENSNSEVGVAMHDEEKQDEQAKRKSDEDNLKESSSDPKKARVSLNHLLSADDGHEDDENL